VPNAALRFTPLPENVDATISDDETTQVIDQVWQLKNGKLVATAVITGATDGQMTEATGTETTVGTALIIKRLPTAK